MPYFSDKDTISDVEEPFSQFIIYDVDGDGIEEIYLNIENTYGSIPQELRAQGLTSQQLLIEFENNKLLVKNYM